MEQNAQPRLIVAGTAYHLDRALTHSHTMPKIELKTSELQPFDKVEVATIEPTDPKMNHGEVTVFKREGKWMLLWGRETARRAIENGIMHLRVTLMSSQALKRCKVETFTHPDHGKPAPAPLYSDEFRNTPRFVDKRPAREHSLSAILAEKHGYHNGDSAGVKRVIDSHTPGPRGDQENRSGRTLRTPYGNSAASYRKPYRDK